MKKTFFKLEKHTVSSVLEDRQPNTSKSVVLHERQRGVTVAEVGHQYRMRLGPAGLC